MAIQLLPAARQSSSVSGIDRIGFGLSQLAQSAQIQRALETAEAERQATIDFLTGAPGQQPLHGGMGPPTAGTPGLLPGVPPEKVAAAVRGGHGGELVKLGLQRQFPEPISALDKERLAMSREGLGLEREALGLRREQFASDQEFQRAKLALEERGLAQQGAAGQQAKLSDIGSFRGQFTGLSEDFMQVRAAYGKVRAAAETPSAAGDLTLVYSFMKMVDPGSVVREGEFATAQNAAGIPEIVRSWYNRIVTGERLTEDQRTDFAGQAHNLFASQLSQQEHLQNAYRGIAQRTMPGVLPEDVVPDFVGTAREWQPITARPSAAAQAGAAGAMRQGLDALSAVTPEAARGMTFDQLLDRFAPDAR